jgi:ribitol 2-dehydrogenase
VAIKVDLTGRRVLVTGASSGIGAETCRSIVACGGAVAMLARRKALLDELHEELGECSVGIVADVTDLDALSDAVAEAARALGGLDAVVAVAGKTLVGGITTGDPREWQSLLGLNLLAPLATVRAAHPHFPATGPRDVILVGSAGGVTPMPGTGVYSASKRGLTAACESLRLELAGEGVRVGCVLPGLFETGAVTLDGLVLDGPMPQNDFPIFAPGGEAGPPAVLGDTIAFMLGLPGAVAINELVIRPTCELNP